MGMRVIVVPNDVTPAEIVHPVLFKPRPLGGEVSLASPPASGPDRTSPCGWVPAATTTCRRPPFRRGASRP